MKHLACSFIALTLIASAHGAVLVQHLGATNPGTEGFTPIAGGTFSVGPLTPDGATGYDAWGIDTPLPFPDTSFALYEHTWTAGELAQMVNQARFVSMRLRVVDASDAVDGGMIGYWSFGGREYFAAFGSNGSGDPIVGLSGPLSFPTQYTVTGAAGQQVLYQFKDADYDGTFRLFVNGVDTGIDTTGFASGSTRFGFGDGTGVAGENGQANWNLMQFEVGVPEPSTIGLLAAGLAVVYARRQRRGCSPA